MAISQETWAIDPQQEKPIKRALFRACLFCYYLVSAFIGRAIALHRDRVTDPDGAGKLCREVRWQVNLRVVCQDDTIEFTDRG